MRTYDLLRLVYGPHKTRSALCSLCARAGIAASTRLSARSTTAASVNGDVTIIMVAVGVMDATMMIIIVVITKIMTTIATKCAEK